jgi:hypothetical protein
MVDLDKVRYKVQKILGKRWNVSLGNRPQTMGDYILNFESTQLNVMIDERSFGGNDSVVVRFSAPILYGVQLTPELYEWVSTQGSSYDFGCVRVVPIESETGDPANEGNLWFNHTILGDYLDPQELHWAVAAVGFTADSLDDELKPMFGGKRHADFFISKDSDEEPAGYI